LVDPTAPIRRRDVDLALSAATKAVEFKPAQGGFRHTLARTWFWKGDYHRALELQQQAVAARPDLPLLQQTLEEYRRRVADPAGR
jgi:protein involved in temperature-dependent protein secretion